MNQMYLISHTEGQTESLLELLVGAKNWQDIKLALLMGGKQEGI